MSVNIVIPVKDICYAKTRLTPVLDTGARARFAQRLYQRTLSFFVEHFHNEHISVVTPSPMMVAIAKKHGITTIRESRATGQSAAAEFAARWSERQGFDSQLLIPADIAELSVEEIKTLLAAAGTRPSVTVCAATDAGTNALLTSPPNVIRFAFGYQSSHRHIQAAKRRGIPSQVLRLPYLSHDIDTPVDLAKHSTAIGPLLKSRHRNG